VQGPLTTEERRLRWLLLGHAILSGLLACGYLIGRDTSTLAFLPNSFAKDVLFAVISVIGAADVRRFGWTALVLAAAYLGLVVGEIATLVIGGAPDVGVLGIEVGATTALLAWLAVDVAFMLWFFFWWSSAVRARYALRYLHPVAFVGLVALAEVLIEGRREAVPPENVAHNVDGYLADLQARRKWRVHLALAALGTWPLIPPLPALSPAARKRFLERRVEDVAAHRTFRPLRPVVQAAIRTGAQMSYLGYYGDRASWEAIGYTPYAARRPAAGVAARPDGRPLRTLALAPRDRYDTVVVGSGAAGAILASRLAESGRRVLVVERGPYVDPGEFTDDEVEQYLRLYNEGALQLARDFSLQVLQGMCVGGGTTINNALCVPPPAAVLGDWAERGLDRPALEAAIGEVRDWLGVSPIRPETTTIAAQRFAGAVGELGLPGRLELMDANLTTACRGSGYCNIGCAYGGKRAALDAVLPDAQRRSGLEVLPGVEVERIRPGGVAARRVSSGEELSIIADQVVVAAGAIGSSWLLQRSGL
jgi:hypothetical protein